jgi:hypothetical protein
LIAGFFAAGNIPAAGAQPALIAAWLLVFNENLVFSGDRPSAIKETVGTNISRYGRLYSPATKRVWNVSSASAYTESGSPAQLLVWTQARTAATSTLDVNPSDFASISLTNLQPKIISRPSAWRITQSSTAGTIEQTIFDASRKAD